MNVIAYLFSSLFFCVSTSVAEIVAPGVIYEKIVVQDSPLVIHELQVNPAVAKIVLAASHNMCSSAEKTSDMVKRNNALAAINGGFFDFGVPFWKFEILKVLELFGYGRYNAFPVGALKIDKRWFSLSTKSSGVMGWNDGGKEVVSGTVEMVWSLKVGDRTFPVADLNKPIVHGPALYTFEYGEKTPQGKNILEIMIKNRAVASITRGGGTSVSNDCYLYACDAIHNNIMNLVHVGDAATLVRQYKSSDAALGDRLEGMDYVIGAFPLLIQNGCITPIVDKSTSPFFTKLYPRTAMGILADGTWLLIVVDGVQATSVGITLKDLASYMQRRGCVVALNLYGDGFSTMVVGDKVVNSLSGRTYALVKKELPLADAILVMSR